jgi:hypothetical protein
VLTIALITGFIDGKLGVALGRGQAVVGRIEKEKTEAPSELMAVRGMCIPKEELITFVPDDHDVMLTFRRHWCALAQFGRRNAGGNDGLMPNTVAA